MGLFQRQDLLYKEGSGHSEVQVTFLNGILVATIRVHNLVALDERKLSPLGFQFA